MLETKLVKQVKMDVTCSLTLRYDKSCMRCHMSHVHECGKFVKEIIMQNSMYFNCWASTVYVYIHVENTTFTTFPED